MSRPKQLLIYKRLTRLVYCLRQHRLSSLRPHPIRNFSTIHAVGLTYASTVVTSKVSPDYTYKVCSNAPHNEDILWSKRRCRFFSVIPCVYTWHYLWYPTWHYAQVQLPWLWPLVSHIFPHSTNNREFAKLTRCDIALRTSHRVIIGVAKLPLSAEKLAVAFHWCDITSVWYLILWWRKRNSLFQRENFSVDADNNDKDPAGIFCRDFLRLSRASALWWCRPRNAPCDKKSWYHIMWSFANSLMATE